MGAHSLGKASREDNGFDGVWTPGQETSFNVTYYENMIAKNLSYKNVVIFFDLFKCIAFLFSKTLLMF